MTTSPEMVTIGKIDRPFGVHGAVKVRSLSDRPGRFEQLGAGSRRRIREVRRLIERSDTFAVPGLPTSSSSRG